MNLKHTNMLLIQVAAAVIIRNQQILIAQRPLNKHQGGLWEFPGGKIEIGESDFTALSRELKEEINIQINAAIPLDEICHEYAEKSVNLKFFLVNDFDGEPQGLEGQPIRWVTLQQLSEYQFPEANQPIVMRLLANGIG